MKSTTCYYLHNRINGTGKTNTPILLLKRWIFFCPSLFSLEHGPLKAPGWPRYETVIAVRLYIKLYIDSDIVIPFFSVFSNSYENTNLKCSRGSLQLGNGIYNIQWKDIRHFDFCFTVEKIPQAAVMLHYIHARYSISMQDIPDISRSGNSICMFISNHICMALGKNVVLCILLLFQYLIIYLLFFRQGCPNNGTFWFARGPTGTHLNHKYTLYVVQN